jgi:hypothetical protein
MPPARLFLFPFALLLFLPHTALAAPPLLPLEAQSEERFADGDLDAEDIASLPGLRRARTGSLDLRAQSWISLVGFSARLADGTNEVGAMAIVGIALDRIATGPVRRVVRSDTLRFLGDPPAPPLSPPHAPAPTPAPTPTPTPAATQPDAASFLLTPRLARAAVAAAWKAAGLDASDARLDAIVARARLSAALPETRLRAMKSFDDSQRTDMVTTDPTARYYDASGARLWLEARLTWRLDRLLYADDEPTLERVRLERQEARGRIASHVLDLLFQWQRARLDMQTSVPRSRAELEATLRMLETEAALDVATGGWFTTSRMQLQQPEADPGSPPPP